MRERVCTHTRNALPTGPAEEPAAEGAEQPASGGIPVHSCYFCFARVRICGWVGALVGDKIGETRRVLVSAMHGMILTARVTRTGICRACRRWKCPKWSCRHGWGARRGNPLRAHRGKGPHLAASQAFLRCPRSRCPRSRRSRGKAPRNSCAFAWRLCLRPGFASALPCTDICPWLPPQNAKLVGRPSRRATGTSRPRFLMRVHAVGALGRRSSCKGSG